MRRSWLLMSLVVLLFSCTTPRERQVNKEEYPDFSEEKTSTSTTSQEITMCPPKKARGARFHVVEISQMKFLPTELVLQKGDTVQWINKDITVHDVTEVPNKKWHSTPLSTGQSWQWIVTSSADYFCSIHVVMKGKVIVK